MVLEAVYNVKMEFREWLVENMIDAKRVAYTACVLHKFSQKALVEKMRKLMFETVGSDIPEDWIIRAHHMTIKFAPNQSDIDVIAPLLGKEMPLEITDWALDDYCVAVVVKPKVALSGVKIPHITVAHSRDVRPIHSNTLLAHKASWMSLDGVAAPLAELGELNSEVACVLRDQTSTYPELLNPATPTFHR